MAFPTVESVTEEGFAGATTSHAVDMPATVTSGDLLLMIFASYSNSAITTPSGWTELAKTESQFVSNAFYAKKAVGTEGGTEVDVVTAAGVAASAHVYRITAWGGTIATDIDISGDGGNDPPIPTFRCRYQTTSSGCC